MYLPPPVEDPEIDVITSTVRILPIGRTGDGTDGVDIDAEFPDHHHGHDDDDPLGWLRESIPGRYKLFVNVFALRVKIFRTFWNEIRIHFEDIGCCLIF